MKGTVLHSKSVDFYGDDNLQCIHAFLYGLKPDLYISGVTVMY